MSTRLVDRAARLLAGRTTRRGFLANTAVVGSALVVAPRTFVLEPTSAYASICGPARTYAAGYSAFCCTINRGRNRCPPGTFAGGWWRADGSRFCCSRGRPGARYYIDCQAECTRCSSGCRRHRPFCSRGCWNCRPHAACCTCDRRRVCANVFRYGQCHQEIACSGPVACRVVTCVPPYRLYRSCGSTSAVDNATAQHSAPCLSGRCA
ncbi:MAG TPA: twin-arginine translocation signal domain-containing protein [Frankiaceae bacterium]|nr:twin-arginine translocation signal domain-containing protein [Frankiaceae bacterium]